MKSFRILRGILTATMAGLAGTAMAAEDPAHEALRQMRKDVLAAIATGDIEGTLKHVHTNAVVTWQNNEVCRGHAGLRDFFLRMGKESFIDYVEPPTPDDLTILYGDDAGVSFGRTVANYKLLGANLEFASRWTATVVKEGDRWLLAGYHISLNALDNPILNGAKKAIFPIGGVCAVIGAVLGFLVGKAGRKKA